MGEISHVLMSLSPLFIQAASFVSIRLYIPQATNSFELAGNRRNFARKLSFREERRVANSAHIRLVQGIGRGSL